MFGASAEEQHNNLRKFKVLNINEVNLIDVVFVNHMFTTVTPQQPVTWQPSKDGERLIGRILLNKRMKDGTVPADTGALLGLKVMDSSSSCFFTFDLSVQFHALLTRRVFSGRRG